MKDKTLNDYFPDMITGNGLFTAISSMKWWNELSPAAFDTYFALHFGEHKAYEKVLNTFANEDGIIEGEDLKRLARVILNINANSWEHIYKALTSVYNPIENTDYVEEINEDTANSGNTSATSSASATSTNDVYGFNSSTKAPASESGATDGSETGSEFENAGNRKEVIRKHGNIGVTTNAEMIVSDIEIWKNKIADKFSSDICDLIALSIY